MNAILALMQYLPAALSIGLDVKTLIEQTTQKALPTTGLEVFANQALKSLPALIEGGKDITAVVTKTNAIVQACITENRGPTDAEWGDQANHISSLEAELDQAAKA